MPWIRDSLKVAENREIVVPWDETYVGKMYRRYTRYFNCLRCALLEEGMQQSAEYCEESGV